MPRFIGYYYSQYFDLIVKYWHQMSPMQYVSVLILIAAVGWFMMKSASKR